MKQPLEKGPKIACSRGEGEKYALPAPAQGSLCLKVDPASSPYTTFGVSTLTIDAGGSIPAHGLRATDRLLFCLGGTGVLVLEGAEHHLTEGALGYCGLNQVCEIRNIADGDLTLLIMTFPPGVERLAQLEPHDDERWSQLAELVGLASPDELAEIPEERRGPCAFLAPDEGDSYWQGAPSAGHVTVKLSPLNFRLNHFAAVTQLLEPGAHIVEHAHQRNDELLVAFSGAATVEIEGNERPFEPGDLVLAGRFVRHKITNRGDEPFEMLGVIMPPGIEAALTLTGRPRQPGEARPVFDRSPEAARALVERFWFASPDQLS